MMSIYAALALGPTGTLLSQPIDIDRKAGSGALVGKGCELGGHGKLIYSALMGMEMGMGMGTGMGLLYQAQPGRW